MPQQRLHDQNSVTLMEILPRTGFENGTCTLSKKTA